MRLFQKILQLWRFQGQISLFAEASLAALLLATLTFGSAYQLRRVQRASSELAREVETRRQVVMALRQFIQGAGNVQSGARGYALWHDPAIVQQFSQGAEEAREARQKLKILLRNDQKNEARFRTIMEKYDAYMADAVPALINVSPVTLDTEEHRKRIRKALTEMEQLREIATQFDDEEIEVLRQLESSRVERARQASDTYGIISLCTICLGCLGSVMFALRVRNRIVSITESARLVTAGDYARRVETGGNREFGELALAFNSMVMELEERRRQEVLSKSFWELLHASATMNDVKATVAQICPQWMPGSAGSLYVMNHERNVLESCAGWGDHELVDSFPPMQCWALRMGRAHSMIDASSSVRCEHLGEGEESTTCLPLVAHGETVGLIVLVLPLPELHSTVLELGEALAMTIANLHLKERMQAEANRDPLTGLFNRRYLNEALDRELTLARRHNLALTVIALDIDFFKSFNDNFGHSAGDLVLKQIARTMTHSLRGSDIVCRQGGEEFLAILPHCRAEDGGKWGEVIRQAVQGLHLAYENQLLGTVTISAGVAGYPEHGETPDELLEAADRALYESKERSRNCVTIAREQPPGNQPSQADDGYTAAAPRNFVLHITASDPDAHGGEEAG
ncbi:MAG: diguanylate cyclase [Acidobacteriota bacterium]|nr:diguanylate cyclase [Acidobacteriota bacterium]